jgi:hypothetical protein
MKSNATGGREELLAAASEALEAAKKLIPTIDELLLLQARVRAREPEEEED